VPSAEEVPDAIIDVVIDGSVCLQASAVGASPRNLCGHAVPKIVARSSVRQFSCAVFPGSRAGARRAARAYVGTLGPSANSPTPSSPASSAARQYLNRRIASFDKKINKVFRKSEARLQNPIDLAHIPG
jgi:hypothetical protein